MMEEYFDAHIGICPAGSVHVRNYSSLVCSSCIDSINFKITQEEFDKLKKYVHPKTKSKEDE